MERVISNSQNFALYPLAGAAVGILISKTVVPLNAMQSALWVGGLTSTTAFTQQGLQSMLHTNDTPLVKVALAIGISAALYFASLSSYGASLLDRLSDEVRERMLPITFNQQLDFFYPARLPTLSTKKNYGK